MTEPAPVTLTGLDRSTSAPLVAESTPMLIHSALPVDPQSGMLRPLPLDRVILDSAGFGVVAPR